MKRLYLRDTCTQYTVSRNRYGDLEPANPVTISCMFRDIAMLLNSVNGREETNILGLFWFDLTSGIKKSDVVGYNGNLYRIEEVTQGKELLKNERIMFIKCTASLYRAVS